jgi:phage terminase large subunit-like protein
MLTIPGHRVAIIVPDFGVGRDVCIEGRSGLHGPTAGDGVLPADRIKTWNRSLGELVLDNGSIAKIFGCDKRKDAEKLRGFEFSTAWFEEIGSSAYGDVAWDMLEFGLRADDPKVVITSTPRPTPLIKRLCADPDIQVVTGSTYDNIDNLSPKFAARIRRRYEGTTLGRQELYGEILDGSDGALWNYDIIARVAEAPHLVTVVVAVDPAGTAHATSDLTGILVLGLGEDGKIYVLADKSGRYSPEQWRRVVVQAYEDYNADAVVAEVNFGADMVAANLRTSDIGIRPVFVPVRASRGKAIRATPVVGLYEQGRGKHVGTFPELEVELTTWVPPGQFDADGEPIPESKWSPNRLDALVWGCTHLALKPRRARSRMRFPLVS